MCTADDPGSKHQNTAQIKNNLRACRQHVGIPILLDLDIGGAAGLEAPDDGEDEEQFCSAHILTPVLLNIVEDCLKAGVGRQGPRLT